MIFNQEKFDCWIKENGFKLVKLYCLEKIDINSHLHKTDVLEEFCFNEHAKYSFYQRINSILDYIFNFDEEFVFLPLNYAFVSVMQLVQIYDFHDIEEQLNKIEAKERKVINPHKGRKTLNLSKN